MNEKLNVSTHTTAAESPWSNGTVERHSEILQESKMKPMRDTNLIQKQLLPGLSMPKIHFRTKGIQSKSVGIWP